MDNDKDLRAAFKALAREDSAAAPPYRRERPRAARPHPGGPAMKLAWVSAGALAAAASVAGLLAVLSPAPAPPMEPFTESWTAPSDFLLATPGSEPLSGAPEGLESIDLTPTTGPDNPPDSSHRSLQ
jgi:hypothetical protein